jgi:hypothetical protein
MGSCLLVILDKLTPLVGAREVLAAPTSASALPAAAANPKSIFRVDSILWGFRVALLAAAGWMARRAGRETAPESDGVGEAAAPDVPGGGTS